MTEPRDRRTTPRMFLPVASGLGVVFVPIDEVTTALPRPADRFKLPPVPEARRG